ncbi:MAG: potassium/proton antiporter [Acidobacteriota bacterium]
MPISGAEPLHTAGLLLSLGVLLAVSVWSSRFAGRLGVPVALLFLLVGVAAGSEGLGGIFFDNFSLSFRLGTLALVLILFDGGLNTPIHHVRPVLLPAAVLATLGVAITAMVVAVGGRWLGLTWLQAGLLGAIVSSTDAAAVFSVLRTSGVRLRQRLSSTLELESGLNDPLAVILTIEFAGILLGERRSVWMIVGEVALELAIGAASGYVFGMAGRWLVRRARLSASGLYPVLTLGLALAAFGAPTFVHGSGFLSVYVAGIVFGAGRFPQRATLLRVHDGGAWLAQVGMFMLLGLQVVPSRLLAVSFEGIAITLVLGFIARPLAVALCLLPFKYSRREVLFLGWSGLRGAVPIVLATYPVLAGVPGAPRLFNLVFFVVVLSALVPGATVRWAARRLGLAVDTGPAAAAPLEMNALIDLDSDLLSFNLAPAAAASGVAIADLPLPEESGVIAVVRGRMLLAPKPETVLQAGDAVYLACRDEDQALMRLIFGREE